MIPYPVRLAAWDRALSEEIGIRIRPPEGTDKRQFVNGLYKARQDAKNPDHEKLMLFQPNNGEVWIVKKATEVPL